MNETPKSTISKKHIIGASLGAGLYPLLHYYNGNFDISDTWTQLLYMLLMCLVLPFVAAILGSLVTKLSLFSFLRKNYLAAVNFMVFSGLLTLLIFHFDRKYIVLTMAIAGLLSFVLHRFLSKIVILQFLLAIMSVVTLVPKLGFMMSYDDEWAKVSDGIIDSKFKSQPNIYVIQPDGYTSFEKLRESPYLYPDTSFENELKGAGFDIYNNFRSNYYSTLTSNASMFAMKHHYYQNTYKGNLKTYRSQDVIVGENNVLSTLKNNGYTTHLLTDNSFFLTNRKLKGYDHCNVSQSDVLFYDTGGIYTIDIVEDFEESLEGMSEEPQFFFIEKTTPSHIAYIKKNSQGIEGERATYLNRLEAANIWLERLIGLIHAKDDNPLIIIAADHGGYVGLNYVKEVEHKELNEVEAISVFNGLLTVKWPKEFDTTNFNPKSSVNLFRQVFAVMSEDQSLLEFQEKNESFLPVYDGMNADFYRVINDDETVEYTKLEN